MLDLTVDGTVYPAIVKELQRHPVRRSVTHVDFLQVNLDEEITVRVPLRLEGEATKVLQGGGLVDPSVDTIEVVTTPRHIPDEFVVDITDMDMDTVIRLADIPMPAGVTADRRPRVPGRHGADDACRAGRDRGRRRGGRRGAGRGTGRG